jgi:lipoate---protein ligase
MIRELKFYRSRDFDPYRNIALEEYFFKNEKPGVCLLYLWQNRDTVVVGRNQNCRKECLVRELEADGGHLARRLSGGGAVFHDEGNLNFTFLVNAEDYDLDRQLDVILGTVTGLGIRAEKTGRNDLYAEGKKFSGNAFYFCGGKAYHHGTILVSADMAKAGKYLGAPGGKLADRGVKSVRSVIANLCEHRKGLTVEEVAESVTASFSRVYGLEPQPVAESEIDRAEVEAARQRFASPDWKYNRDLPFTYSFARRFPWGGIEFLLDVKDGRIDDLDVVSDAMNETLILEIAGVLRGLPLSSAVAVRELHALAERTRESERPVVMDTALFISEQNF